MAIQGDLGFDQEDILTVEIIVQWDPLEGGSDPGDLDLEDRDHHTGGLASIGCCILYVQNMTYCSQPCLISLPKKGSYTRDPSSVPL